MAEKYNEEDINKVLEKKLGAPAIVFDSIKFSMGFLIKYIDKGWDLIMPEIEFGDKSLPPYRHEINYRDVTFQCGFIEHMFRKIESTPYKKALKKDYAELKKFCEEIYAVKRV